MCSSCPGTPRPSTRPRCSAGAGSTTSASRRRRRTAFDLIRERLITRGCTDGFVTDFGVAISLFFIDPDGLEGEVLLDRAGTGPADLKPPGTPAVGYERVADA